MKKQIVLAAFAGAFALCASSAFAANTLAVNAGAALNGTNFGMAITVDPTASNPVYVQSDHPTSETHIRLRWRMRFQAQTAPAAGPGRSFRFMNVGDVDSAASPHKVFFAQRQSTTGNWRFAAWSWDTPANTYVFAGGLFLFSYLAPDDVLMECESTPATAPGNGVLTCTKVGTAQTFTNSTLNDTSRQTDNVQFGFFDFDNFNSAGTAHFDEYESYR